MDVSFNVFSPAPVLSFDDDLCDAPLGDLSDDGLPTLDFSPMDICMDDEQDYIDAIDHVKLSLNDLDTTLVDDPKMDNLDSKLSQAHHQDTIAPECSLDTNSSSVKAPNKRKPAKRKNKAKSNLCSVCGIDLKRSKKCKQCSKQSTKTLQYDSGISSGDDITATSPEPTNVTSTLPETSNVSSTSREQSNDITSDKPAPRRSGRRRSTVDKQYELRTSSLVNRVEVERRQTQPKQLKPKTKPPPLSKYRRKTANARERTRMNEINDGFEELKNVIPNLPEGKLTKITTLRLALNYISALRSMLGYKDDYALTPSDDGCSTSPSDNLNACSPTGSDSSGADASASDTNTSETGSTFGGSERSTSTSCDSMCMDGLSEEHSSNTSYTGESSEQMIQNSSSRFSDRNHSGANNQDTSINQGDVFDNCGKNETIISPTLPINTVSSHLGSFPSSLFHPSADSLKCTLPSISQLFSSHSQSITSN